MTYVRYIWPALFVASLVLLLGNWISLWVSLPLFLSVLAIVMWGVFVPSSQVLAPCIYRYKTASNRIALTFDDGPDPELTLPIAQLLQQHGMRATFFMIGRHVLAHPNIVKDVVAAGHEVGNHSFHHPRTINFYSAKRLEQEILQGASAIESVIPAANSPLYYRPPIGLKNPQLAAVATKHKLTIVTWSVRSLDTRLTDPQRIAARVLNDIRPGDIVLLHDGCDQTGTARRATYEALPLIISGLQSRGLTSVTVSELFASDSVLSAKFAHH